MHNLHSNRPLTLSLGILVAVLVVLPFSYHPLLTFGSIAGVHIDLSFLYVIVALAVIISLPFIWSRRVSLSRSNSLIFILAFILFSAISVSWSANTFRGIATVLFLLMLVCLACVVSTRFNELKQYQPILFKLLTLSVGISLIWALWQVFGDAFGVTPSLTLLPVDYQSAVFGVARPNGFALEPQFLACILLIPFIWFGWRHLTKVSDRQSLVALPVVTAVLFLTLSRGGLYAACFGIILLFIFEHARLKRWLSLLGLLFLGVFMGVLIIFSAATINQRDSITGYGAVSKALNHLSLGVISLPEQADMQAAANSASLYTAEGYVSSSTNSRLGMSQQAISLWTTSPQTILFGVGIGGFGATLHAKDNHYPENSVVNNYYLELLAETGIVGAILFGAFVVLLFVSALKRHQYLIIILLATLLFQLSFFSGNANIIHLWIIVGIAFALTLSQQKQPSHLVQ